MPHVPHRDFALWARAFVEANAVKIDDALEVVVPEFTIVETAPTIAQLVDELRDTLETMWAEFVECPLEDLHASGMALRERLIRTLGQKAIP